MSSSISDRAIAIAQRIVQRKNDAIFLGNTNAVNAAARHYDRLVQALNGGTLFACRAGPESVAHRLEAALAAPDGTCPKWSQSGRFFVVVNGMPCVVVYDGGGFAEHFAYHATAFDRPFISHTGFKSDFFFNPPPGTTVMDFAIQRLTKMQATDMCGIEPSAHAVERNEFAGLPFVIEGLMQAPVSALPAGTRVRLKRGNELGLVAESSQALAEGKLEVALFVVDRKSAKRKAAPLSTVRKITLWPWEVKPQTDEELRDCSEPGKYLTLGMLEALDAINE
jgi:hypothetical protein